MTTTRDLDDPKAWEGIGHTLEEGASNFPGAGSFTLHCGPAHPWWPYTVGAPTWVTPGWTPDWGGIRRPHRCPVCQGSARVGAGFYPDEPARTACRACLQGVVWG